MTGLLLLLALGTVGAIAVAPASADTLCKASEDPCSVAIRYPEATHVEGSGSLLFLDSKGTELMKCASKFLGKTGKDEGAHTGLDGLFESLTVSNCTGVCTSLTVVNLAWKMLWTASSQGAALSSDGQGEPSLFWKNCSLGINCQYGATELALGFTGGATAKLVALEVPMKKSSGSALCPEGARLSLSYELVSPKPAWLVSLP
jgi:hypothetical protein